VSFHDNDHYNSVRDEKAPPKTPPKRKNSKSKQKGSNPKEMDSKSKPKGSNPQEIGMYVECIETPERISSYKVPPAKGKSSVNNSMSELTVNDPDIEKQTKPPKKSAPCPCGSGQKYKKCCLAREKHAKRVHSMKSKNSTDDESSDTQEEVTMKGNFRVLQI
jgi:hypothetical protein